MSRIPLLPRWVLPSPAGIYDLESTTISEMVPKLYGRMRTMIEDYNKFVDEINEEIRSFNSSSSVEIQNFKQSVEERLRCKFNDLDSHLQKIRLEMKQYTDATLERAFAAFGVTVKISGEDLLLVDATDEKIRALSIYGKTTQVWDPEPEHPATLHNVGDSGSVAVKITNGTDEQQLMIATPEGLPGIPVSEGGNYTDANGKEWICDEIDLKRGVYVKRIARINLATLAEWRHDAGWTNANAFFTTEMPTNIKAVSGFFTIANIMCNRFSVKTPNTISKEAAAAIGQSNIGVYVSLPGVTTAEELTEYFVRNETIMQYIMETPEERPLAAAELTAYKKLHTYMPDTAVTTDSDAGIMLEYVTITQLYLEDKIHDIAVETTREMVNALIAAGEITVGLNYDPETESADIIAGGAE